MSSRALACLALCAAMVGGGSCAHAPPQPPAPQPARIDLAQLEDIFWTCDYLATTRGMDATPVRECAAATRDLRREKFGNSFNRLVEWWRESKAVEHDRRRAMRNDPNL